MSTEKNIPGTVTIGGDLTVANIGYGAMQLTGPKVWGEYPDHDKGVAVLREVVRAGVTFIDTADVYGPHSNEELIREALHPYPDNLVIATKGGYLRGGPEYSDMASLGNKWYLRQAAYMSMRRLGLDQIDLYYLHTVHIHRRPLRAGHRDPRRDEGRRAHPPHRPVQPQRRAAPHRDEHHRHRRRHRPLQRRRPPRRGCPQVAEETGIVFSPWHPGAIPSGPDGEPFHAVIDPIAAKHDVAPQQIALAWQLHHTAASLPIPGTTSVAHLHENLDAASISLAEDEIDAITALAPESD